MNENQIWILKPYKHIIINTAYNSLFMWSILYSEFYGSSRTKQEWFSPLLFFIISNIAQHQELKRYSWDEHQGLSFPKYLL